MLFYETSLDDLK